MCALGVCTGDFPGDSGQLPFVPSPPTDCGSWQPPGPAPAPRVQAVSFWLSSLLGRGLLLSLTRRPGVGGRGRGRPRLAQSSWLIFPAAIDPAASPESISSRQVEISPIESPDLRQGGIYSNLFKQRRAIPSHFYSNLVQGEGGQVGGQSWTQALSTGSSMPARVAAGATHSSWGGLGRRPASLPSRLCLAAWAWLWVWFSQNTKPSARGSFPGTRPCARRALTQGTLARKESGLVQDHSVPIWAQQ